MRPEPLFSYIFKRVLWDDVKTGKKVKMAKNKYYHHDIADFRNETRRFDMEEIGLYISLIDEFFETSGTPLPTDLLSICFSLCIKPKKATLAKLQNILNQRFTITPEGYLHMPTLEKIQRCK